MTGILPQAGVLPEVEIWKFWPIIPTWVGLSRLLFRRSGRRWSGIFPLAVGLAFGAHYFGFLSLNWGLMWPGLLVLIGVRVLLGSLFGRLLQLSGVEMWVPRGWRVEVEVSPVMGAVEDHTSWIDTGESKASRPAWPGLHGCGKHWDFRGALPLQITIHGSRLELLAAICNDRPNRGVARR